MYRHVRFALAVMLCLAPAASGQTVTGTLDGHTTDPAGALVPGVKVAAKNLETGLERTSQSNEVGYFQMPFLPLGVYEVTAQAAGFATTVAQNIVVTLNKTTTVALTLKVSTVQESVTVSDIAALIDLSSGQVRRSIDDTLASTLPSSGRNFLGFASLFPGFQTNPTSGQNNFVTVERQLGVVQRYGHPRHHVPHRRRLERRQLGEPEPAGREHQHD